MKSGCRCMETRCGRACPQLRMSLSGLWLHCGLRGGGAAPETEAVVGATHLFRCLPWHLRRLGCALHPNLRGGSLRASNPMREGQTASRNGRVPVLVGDAGQPDGQPVGQHVLRRVEAALDTLPGRTVGWERPRSGEADGDVHRHPARCRSRHAEMGGRSQPRPRWPDRHRRSGGRGTTASAPATYGTGGVSIADAISCPATPEAPCILVDRHRYGRPAVKTGPPDSRLECHHGEDVGGRDAIGVRLRLGDNPVADSAADMRAVTTGGAALSHHDAPSRRKGGGDAPARAIHRSAGLVGDRRGNVPRQPAVIPRVCWLNHLTVVQASRSDARETLPRRPRRRGHPPVVGKVPHSAYLLTEARWETLR